MDIMKSLEALHCPLIPPTLPQILGDWVNYSGIVSWLGLELQALCPEVDETVTPIKKPSDDLPSFKMELSGILKELGCPYSSVMDVGQSQRFESAQSRQLVLVFLISELQSARIINVDKKGCKSGGSGVTSMDYQLSESSTAKALREICQDLDLSKPPENLSTQQLWGQLLPKIKGRVKGVPLEGLFNGANLTPAQWEALEEYYKELKSDYRMRREMLLKRLDVTVQSFHWSDRLKGDKAKNMDEEYNKQRPKMKTEPQVQITDILAARKDLPIVEKTSSTSVRKNTRSAVNSVVIGKVPDRGGRPDEVVPPPPEMPSWQQRQGAPSGGSGWIPNPNQRGGGPRGGAGGRVQGGWSQPRGGRGDHHPQDQGRGGHRGQDHRGRGGGHYHQYDQREGDRGYYNQNDDNYNNRDGYNNYKQGYQGDNYQQRGGQGQNYRGGGRGGGRGGRGGRY